MSESQSIDIEHIKLRLYEKLKPSGWGDKMKSFILSSEFDTILAKLFDLSIEGKRFTPPVKDMFRAFEECLYKDLSVVMVSMDPYPYIGVASGVAFDCRNIKGEQQSLRFMFDAIQKTVYPNQKYERDGNLGRWGAQGVLMLNAALTTQLDHSGKHIELWKPFTAFLLDTLNTLNRGLIFVFLGDDAKKYSSYIDPKIHYKFYVSHPARAGYTEQREWDSKNIFVEINRLLKKNIGREIEW